jgi:hypothetical protein
MKQTGKLEAGADANRSGHAQQRRGLGAGSGATPSVIAK